MLLISIYLASALAQSQSRDAIPVNNRTTARQGWTASPDRRGTIDILSTCLSTLVICCWTVIHSDMLSPLSTRWNRLLDKILCLVVAIFAPEMVVAVAWSDWLAAKKPLPDGMGVIHGFFANMGGIAFHHRRSLSETLDDEDTGTYSKLQYVDCRGIRQLHRRGFSIEHISEHNIKDKSKSDSLVKTIAILQAGYLAVQVIARSIRHLGITTLEISTLAYIPCSLLTYCFWWNKPFDVRRPILVTVIKSHHQHFETKAYQSLATLSVLPVPVAVDAISAYPDIDAAITLFTQRHYQRYPLAKLLLRIGFPHVGDEEWLEAFPKRYFSSVGGVGALVSVIFGAIHCVAWNYTFATAVELLLWRISCIALMTGPFSTWLLSGFLATKFEIDIWEERNWYCLIFRGVSFSAFAFYLLARLYLIFEVFFALRSLPIDCYKKIGWTEFIPHV